MVLRCVSVSFLWLAGGKVGVAIWVNRLALRLESVCYSAIDSDQIQVYFTYIYFFSLSSYLQCVLKKYDK